MAKIVLKKQGWIKIVKFFLNGWGIDMTSWWEHAFVELVYVKECSSVVSSSYDEPENDDSSWTSSVLSLRYSSSLFESHNSSSDDEDSHRVEPYLYEPEAEGSPDAAGESSDNDSPTERLDNTEW